VNREIANPINQSINQSINRRDRRRTDATQPASRYHHVSSQSLMRTPRCESTPCDDE